MPTTANAVERTLALAIDHLPADLRARLDEQPHLDADALRDCGWRVLVPDRDPTDMRPELAPIFDAARRLDCWWITFDPGVDPVDDLATYPTPDQEADAFERQTMAEIAALTGGA